MARMSLMALVTAENVMNDAFVCVAMMCASVVFPTPGGPQKIMEDRWSLSMRRRSIFPGPTRCRCPAYSSNVRGLRRAARGCEESVSKRLACSAIMAFLLFYTNTRRARLSNASPVCRPQTDAPTSQNCNVAWIEHERIRPRWAAASLPLPREKERYLLSVLQPVFS